MEKVARPRTIDPLLASPASGGGWWGLTFKLSRWGFLVLFACLLVIRTEAYAQQGATAITYEQTVSGEITDQNYRLLYAFSGRAGDVITIRLSAAESDLDPYLVLTNQQGQVIAYSDDDGVGDEAILESLRLEADGQYFIIATRFGHEQGSTTGAFTLSLTRLGSTIDTGAVLHYGASVSGSISAEQPQAVYFFEGQRGDVINIAMQRSSNNLDPYLLLANDSRQILVEVDDDATENDSLNARIINYTLPHTGLYILVATRYGREAGTTTGRFVLTVDQIPDEQRGLAFSDAILLDYGEQANGALNDTTPQRFYYFEGKRGDVVSIQMQRTLGNLNTYLILLDSSRRELTSFNNRNNSQLARVANYSLPADGWYYIMATRADFSEGRTEGEFSLSLNGRAGIAGSTFLEIFFDTPIEGFLSDALPYENFLFQGEAGDVITVRMDRTSDNLDPLLTIYQGTKQIVFDDDSGEGQNAAIVNFRLPEAGIYRVEAARLDKTDGTTSGGYILLLENR